MPTARALANVRSALMTLGLPGVDERVLQPTADLVVELGLDSLRFVDLTLAIEDEIGVTFPMQEWVDERLESDAPLTVGALAEMCDVLSTARVAS
jgi:acyl carrier protein